MIASALSWGIRLCEGGRVERNAMRVFLPTRMSAREKKDGGERRRRETEKKRRRETEEKDGGERRRSRTTVRCSPTPRSTSAVSARICPLHKLGDGFRKLLGLLVLHAEVHPGEDLLELLDRRPLVLQVVNVVAADLVHQRLTAPRLVLGVVVVLLRQRRVVVVALRARSPQGR